MGSRQDQPHLCTKLGVSRRLYREAFEPMILTGLFAPGEECSAAAALGMGALLTCPTILAHSESQCMTCRSDLAIAAYFFVLKHQTSFDVRWCKGNVGETIFKPWVEHMEARGVSFVPSARVTDFDCAADGSGRIQTVHAGNRGSLLMPGGTQPVASGRSATIYASNAMLSSWWVRTQRDGARQPAFTTRPVARCNPWARVKATPLPRSRRAHTAYGERGVGV